jgi:Domain of unknown function (DUF4136)
MNRQCTRYIVPLATVIGFVLLTCGSALAQDVRYNYAMGTNFAKYKTYRWVDIPNQNHPDQIADQQIRTAIETTLGPKGLSKGNDSAEMLIAYQIAVNQEKQWNAYGGMGGLRFGGMGTATSSTINIGTLVFDMFDAAAKQQIWTGEATKTMNPSDNPQKNQEHLQKSVAKLLKNYPPRAK